jgi:hypothetical protein
MKLMNRIFFDLMGVCLIFYVDDILVYSSTFEPHLVAIEKVMQRLQDHHLHVKISKCVLAAQELEFCGMQVSSEGFAIQQSQVDAMCQYPKLLVPAPTRSPAQVSGKICPAIFGSFRFFADFIPWIGGLALPLYELTSKDCTVEWNVNHQMTTCSIQLALSTAPVLSFFDPSRPETHVYSDASKKINQALRSHKKKRITAMIRKRQVSFALNQKTQINNIMNRNKDFDGLVCAKNPIT